MICERNYLGGMSYGSHNNHNIIVNSHRVHRGTLPYREKGRLNYDRSF